MTTGVSQAQVKAPHSNSMTNTKNGSKHSFKIYILNFESGTHKQTN